MSILTKEEIISKLKELKPKYEKDGFIILGLFGSYARGEADDSSDIDILYDLNDKVFLSKYPAFRAFSKLREVKEELENIFHKKIDIADKTTLNKIGRDYILRDTIYAN